MRKARPPENQRVFKKLNLRVPIEIQKDWQSALQNSNQSAGLPSVSDLYESSSPVFIAGRPKMSDAPEHQPSGHFRPARSIIVYNRRIQVNKMFRGTGQQQSFWSSLVFSRILCSPYGPIHPIEDNRRERLKREIGIDKGRLWVHTCKAWRQTNQCWETNLVSKCAEWL